MGFAALTVFVLLVWYFRHSFQAVQRNHFHSGVMEGRVRANQHHFSVDVLEFFRVSDGLEVTWAHSCNSRAQLQEALAGEAMMIEADVLLRADGTPIMAHPPNTDSDLSLAEFLKETIGSPKGIKLDIKSTAAIEPSLKILKEQTSHQKPSNPVWLNADILPGPCQSQSLSCSHVDPHVFISLCTKYFPSATLSVGWTTNSFISVEEDYYEWHFVRPMKDLLSDVSQPVTFPVRANLIGRSMEQMLWLLSLSDDYTLTIWSATFDKPNTKDLVTLCNKVSNKTRIFFDLPTDQQAEFLEDLKLQT